MSVSVTQPSALREDAERGDGQHQTREEDDGDVGQEEEDERLLGRGLHGDGAVPLAASMARPSTLIFAFRLGTSRRGRLLLLLGSNFKLGLTGGGRRRRAGSSRRPSRRATARDRRPRRGALLPTDLAEVGLPAAGGTLATVVLLAPTATRPADIADARASRRTWLLTYSRPTWPDAHFPLLRVLEASPPRATSLGS